MKERCERALELLWTARFSEEPDTPELVEARRHLEDCPPCLHFLRRDGVLAARIRELKLCGATPCPGAVRAAIAAELALTAGNPGEGRVADAEAGSDGSDRSRGFRARLAERRRHWPSWAEGAMAAAGAAVLIAGGLALSDQLEAGLPDEAFAEDFHRTALPEIVRENVPPREVESFYRAQFAGDGPALMLDAPVTKVAVCNLDGRRGAMIEYDWAGERLVFYQVPRAEDGRVQDMRMEREEGLSVTRWGDERYEYALIAGGMPPEELARLARSART